MLAYDAEVYFSLIGQYNADIWPAQLVSWALGLVALFLVFRPSRTSSIIIGMILGACWLWTGIAFHWFAFAPLNFAAPVFAGLFIMQAALVGIIIFRKRNLRFQYAPTASGIAGLILLAIALGAYTVTGPLFGIALEQSPMFGVSSQTTVLFTLGMLLLAQPHTPWVLAIIPLLWSFYTGAVAWFLAIPQDFALPAAGLLMLALGVVVKGRET